MNKNNSDTKLFLIEIIVNVILFLIAVAICISLFVTSYLDSEGAEALSKATVIAQNVVETIRAVDGNTEILEQEYDFDVLVAEMLLKDTGYGTEYYAQIFMDSETYLTSYDIVIWYQDSIVFEVEWKLFTGEE